MTDTAFTCEIHGTPDQETLAGYGNPPSCPKCQQESPGAGRFPMDLIEVKPKPKAG